MERSTFVCIFHNLNQSTLKDNYPFMVIDQVLKNSDRFINAFYVSFFGYNQVEVSKEDQHKATFTTPWGTFTYCRIPFGIINVSARFQREIVNQNFLKPSPFFGDDFKLFP